MLGYMRILCMQKNKQKKTYFKQPSNNETIISVLKKVISNDELLLLSVKSPLSKTHYRWP